MRQFAAFVLMAMAAAGAFCRPPAPAEPPANAPQLSLARPYAVYTDGQAPAPLMETVSAADAADWYRLWRVDAASSTPKSLAARRAALNLRGRVVAAGDLPALIALGGAADHPGIVIRPAVTRDAAQTRYHVGFLVRLAADLCRRIPLPTLDLTALKPADAPWISFWVDDCVRNGVIGLRVLPPKDEASRKAVDAALAPLAGPNVYLPPAAEVALVVPAAHPAADAVFRAYAGLRASGVWPEFVSDAQLASREVSLARFKLIVAPVSLDAKTRALLDDAARRGATVLTISNRKADGGRILAAGADGSPALVEHRTGDGREITARVAPWSAGGSWSAFWHGLMRDAGVPDRPWLEAVTAVNVRRITGTYTRPKPVK